MMDADGQSSVTPLHGLLVLALVGLIGGLAGSAAKLIKNSGGTADLRSGGCLYVVYRDRECLGAVFLHKASSLADIVGAFSNGRPQEAASGIIPCGTSIRLSKDMRLLSYSSIPGDQILSAGLRIDVNKAQPRDLVPVPGIGPKLAHRIVQHRNASGDYRTIEDLKEVPGIGREKLAGMAPFLKIGNAENLLPVSGRPDLRSSP